MFAHLQMVAQDVRFLRGERAHNANGFKLDTGQTDSARGD
jgi:hypothetical protein